MSNKYTLGVDIDSTIWDSQKLYSEAAEELFGHGYSQDDVTHYYWLKEEYGENYWEIFNKALHPSWIHKRELYPNVVDAIEDLKSFGINIHFVTYNIHPDLVREPLKKWLQDSFGDVGLSVTGVGKKVPILSRINAFGIVDDKPETLLEVCDSGKWACRFIQPWNEHLSDDPSIDSFDDWSDGYDIIVERAIEENFSKVLTM